MNYYEAIRARKSIRKYEEKALPEELLAGLMAYTKKLIPYAKDISVQFTLVKKKESTTAIKGNFLVKAPYFLLLSSELKQDYLLNAGYLMEQVVLYLTMHGIGTCYQGALRPSDQLKEKMTGEYVTAVAFGYAAEQLYREGKRKKQLPEETTVIYREETGAVIKEILRTALLSPSGLNAQPWRIVAYHNRLHIFCRKDFFFRDVLNDIQLIDLGIFLANLKLAAEECWMNTHFVWMESIADKTMERNEYIITALLEENEF